jgi:two-component system response regulator FixJ
LSTSTIYVVDDDEAVRESLGALLEAQGYQVKGFASAEDFLRAYRGDMRGCLLVDLRMPGMDGLTLLQRLASSGSKLPVVVVTGHGDVPLAVRAMKAGAVDFLQKPYGNEAMLEVVRRALASEVSYEDIDADAVTARLGAITPRERDVLGQLVVGHPNKIIAHELNISPRTVEIHRANLMKKMQADSLSHLVRMALVGGIGPKPR